jgi:hypothetical protein
VPTGGTRDIAATPVTQDLPISADIKVRESEPDFTAEAIMVTIMEMHTGKVIAEPEPYVDEVLIAGWMPHPLPQLAVQSHESERHVPAPCPAALADVEKFLQDMYRNQE